MCGCYFDSLRKEHFDSIMIALTFAFDILVNEIESRIELGPRLQ